MTSEIEYSYFNDGFSLNINENLMTRAVRVKTTVKDKIKRVFDKNVLSTTEQPVNNGDVVNNASTNEVGLLDLSEGNLTSLNDSLNALQSQSNVPCTISRAVLFTRPLVSKIERVTSKWFNGMPTVERKTVEVAPLTDNGGNNAVGNVIPGTWDDMPENSYVEGADVEKTSTPDVVQPSEPIPSFDATIEEPSVLGSDSNMNIDFNNLTSEATDNVASEEEPSASSTMDFVFNNEEMDNETSNEDMPQAFDFVPESNLVNTNEEKEFVPEPDLVNNNEEKDFVPEPDLVSANEEKELVPETTSLEPEVEEPKLISQGENELLANTNIANDNSVDESSEVKPEESTDSIEGEKSVSIEEKIAELIQRKHATYSDDEDKKVVPVSETVPNEEEDRKVRDSIKPELTQAGVIARLQRLNNAMKEKDATIRTLTAKNEAAKEETSQAKEKMRGYEAVVNDLTEKNASLVKENEKLTAKVEEVESASKTAVTKLETQVHELTDAREEDQAASKKVLADLKEKYEKEIASLKESHARELRAVSETKERQIQAIYATISEALGEPVADEDYGVSKAA